MAAYQAQLLNKMVWKTKRMWGGTKYSWGSPDGLILIVGNSGLKGLLSRMALSRSTHFWRWVGKVATGIIIAAGGTILAALIKSYINHS